MLPSFSYSSSAALETVALLKLNFWTMALQSFLPLSHFDTFEHGTKMLIRGQTLDLAADLFDAGR